MHTSGCERRSWLTWRLQSRKLGRNEQCAKERAGQVVRQNLILKLAIDRAANYVEFKNPDRREFADHQRLPPPTALQRNHTMPRRRPLRVSLSLGVLLSLSWAMPARGVVVSSIFENPTLSAPGPGSRIRCRGQ